MPGVEVKIVPLADGEDDSGAQYELPGSGELRVRGPAVFREYWRKPKATAGCFANKRRRRAGGEEKEKEDAK